ncbi:MULTISPECIES: hypothetical protein [unclassified Mycobacterium]|uniref:hypothetical protein n=1 Tax=unclassified Mycobacterium TaxID=2642494 RepID=UPI0029C8FC8D|nr:MULTISPECIES: hypothetical protein [unclassified Mycobacterium]
MNEQQPRSRELDPKDAPRPPARSAVPTHKTQPVPLRSDALENYLAWAATVPHTETSIICETIARGKNDQALTDTLLQALERVPVVDVGRHLMLLATIGELRDARAVERLEAFAWSTEPLVHRAEEELDGDNSSRLDPRGALQARAAEMLSFHGTEEADAATLRLAAEHPDRAVRIAAIDAHLYNHGDSPEATQQLLEIVQPQDRKFVGLPRFLRDMQSDEFDQRVSAFYEQNPDERPPQPSRAPGHPTGEPPPPPRRTPEESD